MYPSEVSQKVAEIQQLVVSFISFDPYFVGDGDDDEEMGDASEFEYFSDFSLCGLSYIHRDDEDDFEDDEDVSWKARRAAARLLETVASNRKFGLSPTVILPALLKGIKDRDDGVKTQSSGALLAFFTRVRCIESERLQFVIFLSASNY